MSASSGEIYKLQPSSMYLFTYGEIPRHMRSNPHITAGYRCYLSAKQCLKSVCVLSNELVNIWTHLLMALAWMVILVYDQTTTLSSVGVATEDRFIFLTYVLCVQACMLFSTGYHTFNGHALKHVCMKWYAADLIGIVLGILGCYILGLYYGFYCYPRLKYLYVVTVGALMIFSVVIITNPSYLSRKWDKRRLGHLVTLTLFGIVPAVHWIVISDAVEVQIFLPKILGLYGTLGTAFAFYVSKFPECCLPGRFNVLGHSHNIWHVLTATSFLYWRNAALRLMAYRIENVCS